MKLGIRLRLTILYFCFFALAGVLLSLASWLLLRQSLDALMFHELDERIDDVEQFLGSQAAGSSAQQLHQDLLREYRLKDEGKWLQVADERGAWIYFSNRGAIADPLPEAPSAFARIVPFTVKPGHVLRSLARELNVSGREYRVAMSISADRSVVLLAKFRRDLLLLVPLVLLTAAVVGYFLSRKALDPVQSIASELRRINERNLSTRLLVSKPKDELAHLSETLNDMLERIDAAFRSVRVLTANASHELRTPLSLIRTRIEIALCFPRAKEYYQSALEEILEETLRMSALIETLLNLARYDAGATQPELSPVDLSKVLQKTAREWAGTAERCALNLQLDGELGPLWVLADTELVERILRTLVDNACRYTPSGGWVRLSGKISNDAVVLTVRDNGIGIAEQDLARIFERFYRVEQPQLHHGNRGSGLGLSLARWIAEQHKATITVESAIGCGSCFQVQFPRFKAT